jgi:hypothetical protein
MRAKKKTMAYDLVKGQIGYCGIWCGSCVVGNGALRELGTRFEKVIRDYDLQSWAPGTFDFQEFLKGLKAIKDTPLCIGCRKGGGWGECPMRGCVSKKKIDGCAECNDQKNCPHSVSLEKMRAGSIRAGLFVRTTRAHPRKLLADWNKKVKGRWPSSILFLDAE